MSTPLELWKKWEGRVVDEKFPLRQWLGGSDHSAVFLTEYPTAGSQKAAIKIIAATGSDDEVQLARWAAQGKFSHPHVIRLLDGGSCIIDGTSLLYVVMEYADEDLAQILPLRPLAPGEAAEMLPPAAQALASLHRSGLAHGAIKPSNIMAVGNQLKLSADSLGKIGDRSPAREPSPYDAPEIATSGPSPAADIWSLGATLVAVLTQNEPKLKSSDPIAVPNTIPQPLRDIVRDCLRDPQHRCTVADILRRLQPAAEPAGEATPVKTREVPPPPAPQPSRASHPSPQSSKRWVVVTVVAAALVIGVWLGIRVLSHQSPSSTAENQSPAPQSSTDVRATQSAAPFSNKQSPPKTQTKTKKGSAQGSVLQQVMPDVSRGAQNTITGHVKVSVQVEVDSSGNVSNAKLVSAGPSKYFASRSLAAAQKWKFSAPQVGGQPTASQWLLRFEIGRSSIQAFPSQMKP